MDSFHRSFEKLRDLDKIYLSGELTSQSVMNSMLCGAIAGMVAKTAIAPVERVKLTFQVSQKVFTLKGALQQGQKIIREQGFWSLWKGHLTTVVRVGPYAGINYSVHDYAEKTFKEKLQVSSLPMLYKFLAGSIGGAVATILTYPLDVLRIRIALVTGQTWLGVYRQGGLFHGMAPTLLGIVPYSGTAWLTKQVLAEDLFPHFAGRPPALLEAFLLNAVAGLTGQLVTYPLDVVRRRMQMHIVHGTLSHLPPASTMESLRHLFKSEGIRGMFKGYSLNIFKGPITLSLSLTTYDFLRNLLIHDEIKK